MPTLIASSLQLAAPLLAEGNTMKGSLAWGLVLLCVVLGVMVTVQPVKREKEVKGRKS